MPRILLLLAAVFCIWYGWQYYKKTPPEKRRPLLWRMAFYGLLGIILALVATGRTHWLTAVAALLIPALKSLAKYLLPLILHKTAKSQQNNQQTTGQQTPPNQQMSEAEALQILGLEPGASREAIIEAHRRLIQKLHTDRGGNDYLAAKVNTAKDKLLG